VLKGRSKVKCNWSDNFATLSGSEFFNDIHFFHFQVDLLTPNFWLGGPRNNKSIWNGLIVSPVREIDKFVRKKMSCPLCGLAQTQLTEFSSNSRGTVVIVGSNFFTIHVVTTLCVHYITATIYGDICNL